MDRPNQPDDSRSLRRGLAERLRSLTRQEFGEDGGRCLAVLLGLPPRKVRNYEAGRAIPGEVILAIIKITGVSPDWLLTGLEPMYRSFACGGFDATRASRFNRGGMSGEHLGDV